MTLKCEAALSKCLPHVAGTTVIYSTEFSRADEQLTATTIGSLANAATKASMKAAGSEAATTIPPNGWLIATDEGLEIHARGFLGKVGDSKTGFRWPDVVGITLADSAWPGRFNLSVDFIDGSNAVLTSKTRDTKPAIAGWFNYLEQNTPITTQMVRHL